MKSTDPASLQNLNDIVLPASVGWWPMANGWYFLIGLLLIALTWFIFRSLQRWKNNRYRRAALYELQLLENGLKSPGKRDACLRQIPVLLKRTALSIYPRNRVASLSGESWYEFLNSTVHKSVFTETTFSTLNAVSYSAGELSDVNPQETIALLNASRSWLKLHQPPTRPKDSMGQ